MFKHILIPLDGSPFAEKALEYGISLANKYGGEVTLLQVLPHTWKAEMKAEIPQGEGLTQEVKTAVITNYLTDTEEVLRQQGCCTVNALIMRGSNIAELILEAAKAEHIDSIVMSTHGLTGITRWMLGSVAERVVRHASVPVLLVRTEDE